MDRTARTNGTRPGRTDYDAGRLGELVAETLPRFDTIQDGVIETLRQAILLDILPVGVRLRQEDLAGIFQTSRIPIREALRALEYDGLVRSEPYRGFTVAGLDGEQVEEIYELRTILEEHALRIAIPLLTEHDLDDLGRRYSDFEEAIDGQASLEVVIARLEVFHMRLYGVTARPRLVGLIGRVRQESVRAFRTWRIRPSKGHHGAFWEAVRTGEVEVAVSAMRTHYVRVASLLRRFLREAGSDARAYPAGPGDHADELASGHGEAILAAGAVLVDRS